MKNIYIVHSYYLHPSTHKVVIGGVETYINELVNLLKKMNYNPIIYQFSNTDFTTTINNTTVIGINITKKRYLKGKINRVVKEIEEVAKKDEIIIFSTHSLAKKSNKLKTIGIQHGITFDIIDYAQSNKLLIIKNSIIRFFKGLNTVFNVGKFENLVVVDYNFLNWYRTMPFYKNINIKTIPNFVRLDSKKTKNHKNNERINIIFARRLQKYRGTDLLIDAINYFTSKYNNIYFTIAGEGPEELKLKSLFESCAKVDFIKYKSEESIKIHLDHDIAIIPTIGSEGTSLSLLEAMAADTAIVCTNVGGMTNIVINNYNGLIVEPNSKSLIHGIEKLVIDEKLRKKLTKRGYDTVLEGFNVLNWERSWKEMIIHVSKNKQ